MQDGSNGASHTTRNQGAARPLEGYLVGDVLRSSARINPEGSVGSRLSTKPGKSPERIREEAPADVPGERSEGVSETSGDSTEEDWSGSALLQTTCPEDNLLHSIALEELAIAHLINAEAEKAKAVARQCLPALTPDELIAFQHSVAKVLEMAVEKEKLLLQKLRLLLSGSSRRQGRGAKPPTRRTTE